MRKTTISIILLASALVSSNAWWLYRSIDFGITYTYAMKTCEEDSIALAQVIAILPVAVTPGASRESIVAAARLDPNDLVFDKDGFTYVGQVALRFDAQGKLAGVGR